MHLPRFQKAKVIIGNMALVDIGVVCWDVPALDFSFV